MVLKKEYRICMPLTVEEYEMGQIYMIARHSHEESVSGDGVEVIKNTPCMNPFYGIGQYTEKKIHFSNRLPYCIQFFFPRVFYITEKSWNYYPYTVTQYTCSFMQRFHILIKTRFENNNGTSENCIGLSPAELEDSTVHYLDIAYDEINPRKYKAEEDPKFFQSKVTGRGPLMEGWRDTMQPVMCSYKYVEVSFDVWGLQGKVEELIQKTIRDVLLLGHRKAFAWIDDWYEMSIRDVRIYERQMHRQTNELVTNEVVEEEKSPTAEGAGDSTSNVNPFVIDMETPQTTNWGGWFSWS